MTNTATEELVEPLDVERLDEYVNAVCHVVTELRDFLAMNHARSGQSQDQHCREGRFR
jgi:hypothetical protein